MSDEYNKPSEHWGVKPMTIAGRVARERERLQGMSDAERAWRAQWLKDQILAPDEPVVPENYYQERYNVLRRFYRAPLEKVETALRPRLGKEGAYFVRHAFSKTALAFCGVLVIWYHLKYNSGDWTKKSSMKITKSRPCLYPNDEGFPNYTVRQADDYAHFGFKKSPI